MVLVDTSVWIEHLRKGHPGLVGLLKEGLVLGHSFVIGELACGNIRNRDEILTLLRALPQGRLAEHTEVLHLIESGELYGRGIGWVDSHLLASALITGCGLWTFDRRLQRLARGLSVPSR
ncbi:type II toxin-antitoxin system VapC family toxin [Candidatus Eisenbacteria bacterium]|uniref:Ribonuclease VapC n=1 Tax=Eiseniibacteriota bacterium TaxID=2212470 RepID=A0ABV6YLN1_UNCEI